MGRKNFNAYIKKQKAEKKRKKKRDKKEKLDARKNQESSGKLEDMLAYVDEFGNILSEPPEEQEDDKGEKEKEPDKKKSKSRE